MPSALPSTSSTAIAKAITADDCDDSDSVRRAAQSSGYYAPESPPSIKTFALRVTHPLRSAAR